MTFSIQITPELKKQFQSEVSDHLDAFEKHLIEIENNPGSLDSIHAAFRTIHSIKGNSDYLEISDIRLLAHALEDLMNELRSGNIAASAQVLKILFNGLDLLREMNCRITDENYRETDISEMTAQIRQTIMQQNTDELPKPEEFTAASVTDAAESEIRVSVKKIDEFIRHVSEFTIVKNTLNFLIEQIAIHGKSEHIGELRKTAANISRIANTLQSDVMKLGLVRLNVVFDRLPRMIRELCIKNGKKCRLDISGGDIEIDRKIVEHLRDPLIHLLRNAADHGIASREERISQGKSEVGVIQIRAYPQEHYVIIEVSDDGSGIDIEKVRRTALQQNIFSKTALAEMSDDDILNLIFMPGFSTKSQATSVSGRGVGLDIVKKNITDISGTIEICSESGKGTTVKIRVPISMSLTDALIVSVGERKFAFPLSSVLQTFKTEYKHLIAFGNGKAIVRNGVIIPVRYLSDMIELTATDRHHCPEDILSLIVIQSKGDVLGICVDRVLKRDSLLVKPLASYLVGIREFAGAALMGDGSVVLVIDPMGIV